MSKTRIVGIAAVSLAIFLIAMMMAHFSVEWANLADADNGNASSQSLTPVEITLDSDWIDVMKWTSLVLLLVAIVLAVESSSYGILAVVGMVSFTGAAFFEHLLPNMSGWLLCFTVGSVVTTLILIFTDDRKPAMVPKRPDLEKTKVSRSDGGGMEN